MAGADQLRVIDEGVRGGCQGRVSGEVRVEGASGACEWRGYSWRVHLFRVEGG